MSHHQEFYEKKHQHPINKTLHSVGIPMVVLSFLAVIYSFKIALFLFIVGWACQIIGHTIEGTLPAFLTSPRHFLSGVQWHLKRP